MSLHHKYMVLLALVMLLSTAIAQGAQGSDEYKWVDFEELTSPIEKLVEDFKEEATSELDYYEEQVRSHLINNLGKNLIGFIARKNGTIIATAYLLIIDKIPNPTVRNGRCGEVLSVYTDPHYKKNNTDIYISSGIGTNEIGIRFNNQPSINLFRLEKK